MESRIEKAIERHHMGYNCAQAVACTYCDLLGFDEETTFKMVEGFGLGMGSMNGTCGALSGAVAVLGMMNSKGLGQFVSKKDGYVIGRELEAGFKAKNGATICRDLKGVDTGKVLRSCDGCIEDACVEVEKMLAKHGF